MPPDEAHPNLIGGMFNGLVKSHYVRVVGTQQMKRPGANARLTRVYQGYDPDEDE